LKIIAANRDIGSAAAMTPPLRVLKEENWDVVPMCEEGALAISVFEKGGLTPRTLSKRELNLEEMRRILQSENPSVVIGGVSSFIDSSGRVFKHHTIICKTKSKSL